MAKKVAMVLANSFEDSEAIDPKNHLESLGAEVVTSSIRSNAVARADPTAVSHPDRKTSGLRTVRSRTS